MMKTTRGFGNFQPVIVLAAVAMCLALLYPSILRSQTRDEFDEYKIRLQGAWFYSYPSGSVKGSADQVPVDFQKDLGFNNYSTGIGEVNWKFTHKNHFYVVFSPFYTTKTTTLTRTFTFQGQTFQIGTTATSTLHSSMSRRGISTTSSAGSVATWDWLFKWTYSIPRPRLPRPVKYLAALRAAEQLPPVALSSRRSQLLVRSTDFISRTLLESLWKEMSMACISSDMGTSSRSRIVWA